MGDNIFIDCFQAKSDRLKCHRNEPKKVKSRVPVIKLHRCKKDTQKRRIKDKKRQKATKSDISADSVDNGRNRTYFKRAGRKRWGNLLQ